jgi:hypothetical protein
MIAASLVYVLFSVKNPAAPPRPPIACSNPIKCPGVPRGVVRPVHAGPGIGPRK